MALNVAFFRPEHRDLVEKDRFESLGPDDSGRVGLWLSFLRDPSEFPSSVLVLWADAPGSFVSVQDVAGGLGLPFEDLDYIRDLVEQIRAV